VIDSGPGSVAIARARRAAIALACLCLSAALPGTLTPPQAAAQDRAPRLDLPPATTLAPGVLFYSIKSTTLVTPEEPMAVSLLRLDPRQVELRSVLSNDEIMGTEVVSTMGERYGAIAAVNAGFFLPNGDPNGVLTLGGRLVSDTRRPRGAIAITNDASGVALTFARLRASAVLMIGTGAKATRVPIDGVDTTRARGRLMLFTPSYHADTDTAPSGLEWVVDRPPRNSSEGLRVTSGPHRNGHTPIPKGGFVLSFGGTTPPASLVRLERGVSVALSVTYDPLEGPAEPWANAQDIVGGAGLLIRDGRDVDDWTVEGFNKGFAEGRHPRTMIGSDANGTIWLVAVDGRQPALSVGMTLVELRTLARRLDLVNALNLDGGGSTTMWVQGRIVNNPSDAAGPRKVSDALIVRSLAARARQEQMPVR
jgi:exopolysaccharide biosynthesis protein